VAGDRRAEHESLRELAAAYGVSHETIRAAIRRMAVAQRRAPVA
jgi:DeoR/GlpR family transcriptional regulator of sugar metabolism